MLYTKSLHLDVQPLPFEWKPCFYLCCVGTGTGQLPQSTPTIQTLQKHELATQFWWFTRWFTMFQENIKEIEIKNTLSTTKTNSHPFNVSDKYHVCLGSSTIKTDLQASKFKQQNWLRSCDPQSNLRVALASQQLNIITTRGKPGSQSWKASRNA